MSFPDKMISIHGARTHNLNNIDLSIPCNKLVVITGPSGSGKSSLAFDTIYAEGQRRYVESLSPYARQFLEIMEKPDVDQIDGLSPAISIEQKTISHNPRSTVGTITEIYDYVRLLFARTGILHSPATGKPIKSWTVTQMVDKIISLEKGTRLLLLSPVIRGRKGEFRKEFAHFMKQGFQRVKIDGFLYEMPDIPALNKAIRHDIDVIIDRIVVQDNIAERMADSLETALKLSDGIAIAELADEKDPLKKQIIFSEKFACPESGFSLVEIEPKLFSFNSPFGACPGCNGIGTKVTIDPDLVIPDKNATLEDGAITPWVLHSSSRYLQILNALTEHFGAKNTDKWKDLPPELQHIILYGAGKKSGNFLYNEKRKRNKKSQPFEGVINELQRHCNENHSEGKRREIRRFQKTQNCPDCNGHRLKPEALSVKLDGMHIGEVCQMSISQAQEWFRKLPENLTRKQKEISKLILKEIQERLAFLNNVGLPYLTLSRNSGSLSGGESQRIRLASQIGSGLTGVIYVLDEPSIGLHQRDNARLIKTLENLRELGNTVIMVEHDEEAILAADHIIDVGPFAGIHGGCIVAQGSPLEIKNNPSSLTGQYLSGIKNIPFPEKYRKNKDNLTIQVIEAT
ncbi:MAG: excinuclease ABC subunit UvrA, partial [Alphaproteobacteria bacterium]|nr:excinuclease ABC subunit UvrA [Alphaproteobacteria bacterium]